jgi:hypothetical protein
MSSFSSHDLPRTNHVLSVTTIHKPNPQDFRRLARPEASRSVQQSKFCTPTVLYCLEFVLAQVKLEDWQVKNCNVHAGQRFRHCIKNEYV